MVLVLPMSKSALEREDEMKSICVTQNSELTEEEKLNILAATSHQTIQYVRCVSKQEESCKR